MVRLPGERDIPETTLGYFVDVHVIACRGRRYRLAIFHPLVTALGVTQELGPERPKPGP